MGVSSASKKISLILVLCVAFFDWMSIGLVYPMFSALLFSPAESMLSPDVSASTRGLYLGLLLATLPTVAFFSGPILGTLSDQKGRRKLLLFALLVGVVGYFLAMISAAIKSLWLLIFSRVIQGISAGSAGVAEATIADLSTPEQKPSHFGLFNMACGLGFAIGPFLGGRLSVYDWGIIEGFSVPFFVAGVALFINFLMILWLFKETLHVKMVRHIHWITGILHLRRAFSLPNLKVIFTAAFIFCFGWSFFYEFVPVTWISEYGFGAQEIGTLYAYASAFYALSAGLLIRPIVNRFKAERILFWALLLEGIFILVLFLPLSASWNWAILPVQQFLLALIFPTVATLVSNSVDATMQGELMGILKSVEFAAFALSPLLAGIVLSWGPATPILGGGFAMLLAAAVLFKIRKRIN